jgi:bifunctional UDP-N-acetylglucosamine pyrophosphorylase / glucosamine-1-phosphate N-acetyltransferase
VTAPGTVVNAADADMAASGWRPAPDQAEALIAAAGRGTRLGYHLPKVLYPVEGRPVLAWLADRLAGLAGAITLVLSAEGEQAFLAASPDLAVPVSTVVQAAPTGMADAVLAASDLPCGRARTLVVLWGDQVGVTRQTIVRALAVHDTHALRPAITVPLAVVDAPYVHYEFDGDASSDGRLTAVRQRREGDTLPGVGLADCGCFIVSPGLVLPALRRLSASGLLAGRLSHEQNFLQALPFLAREMPVVGVSGGTLADTIGLNSSADLDRLSRFKGMPGRTDA